MFPKGTAHSFLLASDGYIDNRDGGDLMTEVKAGSGRGGGCITVVADPLHARKQNSPGFDSRTRNLLHFDT